MTRAPHAALWPCLGFWRGCPPGPASLHSRRPTLTLVSFMLEVSSAWCCSCRMLPPGFQGHPPWILATEAPQAGWRSSWLQVPEGPVGPGLQPGAALSWIWSSLRTLIWQSPPRPHYNCLPFWGIYLSSWNSTMKTQFFQGWSSASITNYFIA